MITTNYLNTTESFEEALFYYALDTFYAKPDPEDDEYSFVMVKNDLGKSIFHLKNDYLEDMEFEYALNVIRLNNYYE